MYRNNAGPGNAPPTHPTIPSLRATDQPYRVDPDHRWRCPHCSRQVRHPWLLVIHLVAGPADADRPGHGLAELDAWTTVATLEPVTVAPDRVRRPAVPLAAAG